MKCPKCRTDNPADSKYCKECATSLTGGVGAQPPHTRTFETSVTEFTRGALFAGRYEVIEELGRGGMGAVYRVEDTEAKEEIALKLINPEVAADKKTIERFRKELTTARKIRHKNICGMYDLNEDKGTYFITMQYVSGEDLKSLLNRVGRLDSGTAIKIGKQISEGLSEAHRMGIIHRDLKPSNIMIDKRGDVCIMDFGIARSMKARGITGAGVMIGTPEYMSPEQTEAKDIDQRSDIYSLGVILYEMVTGQLPFESDTPLSIVFKHKEEIPLDPRELNPQIPDELNRLILKCLEKAKEKRFQAADELLAELGKTEKAISTSVRVIPKRTPLPTKDITLTFGRRKLFVAGLAVVALAVALVLSVLIIKKSRPPKTSPLPAHKQLSFTGNASYPLISPDGKFIAYVLGDSFDEQKVMVQDIASGHSIEVFRSRFCQPQTWTPDSTELCIWTLGYDSVRTVVIVPRLGGTARKIQAGPFLTWMPDGSRFAYAYEDWKEIKIDDTTGNMVSLPLQGSFLWITSLDWAPSGYDLLFSTEDEKQRHALWKISSDGRRQDKIAEFNVPINFPQWSPGGDYIYYLMEVMDAKELWKIPSSVTLNEAQKSASLVLPLMNAGNFFSMTNDGEHLVYLRENQYSNLWLAAVGESGEDESIHTKQLTFGTLINTRPSISPDAESVAFSRGPGRRRNIYVLPLEGGTPQQITFFDSLCDGPVWSPDGRSIAFGVGQGNAFKVWKIEASGERPHQFAKTELSPDISPPWAPALAWSPGAFILYLRPGDRNFYVLDPDTGVEGALLADESVGYVFSPHFSPDGENVAFFWNRSAERGIWAISLDGSSEILVKKGWEVPMGWSSDGKWIYFYEKEGGAIKISRIGIENKEIRVVATIPFTFELGEPGHPSMSRDEKHFVIPVQKKNADMWMVDNFDSGIK